MHDYLFASWYTGVNETICLEELSDIERFLHQVIPPSFDFDAPAIIVGPIGAHTASVIFSQYAQDYYETPLQWLIDCVSKWTRRDGTGLGGLRKLPLAAFPRRQVYSSDCVSLTFILEVWGSNKCL